MKFESKHAFKSNRRLQRIGFAADLKLPACFQAYSPNPAIVPASFSPLLRSSSTCKRPQVFQPESHPPRVLGPLRDLILMRPPYKPKSVGHETSQASLRSALGFSQPLNGLLRTKTGELSHSHATSRVPFPVQGLAFRWLSNLIDSNFPPCRFLASVPFRRHKCRLLPAPKPRDSEVFAPTESGTTWLNYAVRLALR
jgi:hypothetical protein